MDRFEQIGFLQCLLISHVYTMHCSYSYLPGTSSIPFSLSPSSQWPLLVSCLLYSLSSLPILMCLFFHSLSFLLSSLDPVQAAKAVVYSCLQWWCCIQKTALHCTLLILWFLWFFYQIFRNMPPAPEGWQQSFSGQALSSPLLSAFHPVKGSYLDRCPLMKEASKAKAKRCTSPWV